MAPGLADRIQQMGRNPLRFDRPTYPASWRGVSAADEPALLSAPPHLWLVVRSVAPSAPQSLEIPRPGRWPTGSRFDSATGSFRVTYLGSTLQACLGESLSVLRPKADIALEVEGEWRQRNWMEPGSIAADWRHRRRVIKVEIASRRSFLNLESPAVTSELDSTLQATIAALGYEHLDQELLRGPDRRVTTFLSDHLWKQTDDHGQPRFAGIRYRSRHNIDWECWAVFEQTPLNAVEQLTLDEDDPAVVEVGSFFNLRIF